MLRVRRARLSSDDRGTALLETALTLPLLLLVCIGIFEFGRAYQTWQILTNAAREGARLAVLPGTADADVKTRVETYLADGMVGSPSSASVSIVRDNTIPIGTGTATASRVTVSYPFSFIVLQPISKLVNPTSKVGAPLTMTASALMRNE